MQPAYIPVLGIHDILVRIRFRGSILLTNGSGSNPGSDSFFNDFKDAKQLFLYIFFPRVSDPHWFNADPDSGSRVWWPKIEKIHCLKFNFYFSKIAIYLSLGLHKGRPSYRKSLQPSREHPILKNMKILDFFLFLWVIFALLDPDPDPQFECWSGSGSSNSN